MVEHPEWRQTITLEALGRHARDDHRRSAGVEREAGDARHRAGAGASAVLPDLYPKLHAKTPPGRWPGGVATDVGLRGDQAESDASRLAMADLRLAAWFL
jgi:hypothetical protein